MHKRKHPTNLQWWREVLEDILPGSGAGINEATSSSPPPPPPKNETTDIGGNMTQRDYQNTSGGETYREFSCKTGYRLKSKRAKPDMNACGPSSWQREIVDAGNDIFLNGADKNCCNDHDACYEGMHMDGGNRIASNKFSNEVCEDELKACVKNGGSILGRTLPLATGSKSPEYFGSDNFECVKRGVEYGKWETTGWFNPNASTRAEKCNDGKNHNGYEYKYNAERKYDGTGNSLCGASWCCKRKNGWEPTGYFRSSGSPAEKCNDGNIESRKSGQDYGYEYKYNAERKTGNNLCGGSWCCKRKVY